jgi:hypothetical protein
VGPSQFQQRRPWIINPGIWPQRAKAIIAYQTGKRSTETTDLSIRDLRERVRAARRRAFHADALSWYYVEG